MSINFFNRFIYSVAASLLLLSSCSDLALHFAPKKEKKIVSNDEAAQQAHKLFLQTLQTGAYEQIPQAMRLLKAEYLKNPNDPQIAARIGFLHIWKLSERYRLPSLDPQITDEAILARKYFEEANKLEPDDARYHGFYSILLMVEGDIHKDEYLTRKGYIEGLKAIDAWPQFNYFTVGYVLSNLPKKDEKFQEALAMQWQNIEACIDRNVNLEQWDLTRAELASLEAKETRSEYSRTCWNSAVAPYNFQGFFMNFGDMLVKNGQEALAKRAYQTAKEHPAFGTWPYKEILEDRIKQIKTNVQRFQQKSAEDPANNILLNTPFSCTVCHQAAL